MRWNDLLPGDLVCQIGGGGFTNPKLLPFTLEFVIAVRDKVRHSRSSSVFEYLTICNGKMIWIIAGTGVIPMSTWSVVRNGHRLI